MSTIVDITEETKRGVNRKSTKKHVSRSVLPKLRTNTTSMNKSQFNETHKEKSSNGGKTPKEDGDVAKNS